MARAAAAGALHARGQSKVFHERGRAISTAVAAAAFARQMDGLRRRFLSHWLLKSPLLRATVPFFIAGALLECWMVKGTIFGVNFYSTLKKNLVEDLALAATLKEIEARSTLTSSTSLASTISSSSPSASSPSASSPSLPQ